MNAWKIGLAVLALGVSSLFVGLGNADAQWGYRGGGYRAYRPAVRGYYAPRASYYGSPYGSYYRSYPSYRSYPYYGGGYGGYGRGYYGGSGVYLNRGGLNIRF